MAQRARKKPVVIEYVDWDGENIQEVSAFLGADYGGTRTIAHRRHLLIKTLENPDNPFEAPPGWKIIRGVAGEHYACDPDIFARTYDGPAVAMEVSLRPLTVLYVGQNGAVHNLTDDEQPIALSRAENKVCRALLEDGFAQVRRAGLLQQAQSTDG